MSHSPNQPEQPVNLSDARRALDSKQWMAQLVASAYNPLRDAIARGDIEAALGILMSIAGESYKRGILDHQATVLECLDAEEGQ